MVRVHVWVSGIVQGVFYRQSTMKQAEGLGLKGWVKNLDDGRVELIAEGDKETVGKLIIWCHQGPSQARVDHIQEEWEDYQGNFTEFSVTH